uniref:Uncharacterized protein n=1 Tax=Arundo donax TaxID=35708 RepID=A0A0A9C3V2_ARUDO
MLIMQTLCSITVLARKKTMYRSM